MTKKNFAHLDEVTLTIMGNKDKTVTDEAISIDHREELRINVDEVSNKTKKSIPATSLDHIQIPSNPPDDTYNNAVDNIIIGSDNLTEVKVLSSDTLGPDIPEEAGIIDNKRGIKLDVEEYFIITTQNTINNKSLAATIVNNEQQPSTNSTDTNDNVVDTVLDSSFNIEEVIALSHEALGAKITKEADKYDNERVSKVGVDDTFKNYDPKYTTNYFKRQFYSQYIRKDQC